MAATTTYLSLGAFYAADKRRDISREHDMGLWWLGDDWHAPRFRAAWVAQTGELYLMQHEGTAGGGRVDVVATGRRWRRWRHASMAGATSSASGVRCTGCASASACLRSGATSRRASSAPSRPTSRSGADALELALVGPGHLDGVLGRRVTGDDVVGRLVV